MGCGLSKPISKKEKIKRTKSLRGNCDMPKEFLKILENKNKKTNMKMY